MSLSLGTALTSIGSLTGIVSTGLITVTTGASIGLILGGQHVYSLSKDLNTTPESMPTYRKCGIALMILGLITGISASIALTFVSSSSLAVTGLPLLGPVAPVAALGIGVLLGVISATAVIACFVKSIRQVIKDSQHTNFHFQKVNFNQIENIDEFDKQAESSENETASTSSEIEDLQ